MPEPGETVGAGGPAHQAHMVLAQPVAQGGLAALTLTRSPDSRSPIRAVHAALRRRSQFSLSRV